MDLPIILKLRKNSHKELAKAQDFIVEELYKIFNKAVIHGGTAIWRCYNGKRFSEDIDVYIPKDLNKLERLFKNLKKIGFEIKKKKISNNSLYSLFQFNRIQIRLEAIFKRVKGNLKEYLTVDSNIITVYTLTPEEFITEKVKAYIERTKIRDLYDIFFMLRYVSLNKKIKSELKFLTEHFKKPVDKNELKFLIIEGIIPSVEDMVAYIKNKI